MDNSIKIARYLFQKVNLEMPKEFKGLHLTYRAYMRKFIYNDQTPIEQPLITKFIILVLNKVDEHIEITIENYKKIIDQLEDLFKATIYIIETDLELPDHNKLMIEDLIYYETMKTIKTIKV